MSLPIVVITGAASGIGLATAKRFAAAEFQVVTCDLNPAPEPRPRNWPVHQLGDVGRLETLQQLFDAANDLGEVACLVNNAGVGLVKPVQDVTEAEWDAVLDTNFKAAFFASQLAAESMRRRGGGSIVNVASNAGLLPRPHDPVYSISKQALVGLTKSLALCLSPDKIRVNSVCPGPVCDTGMVNADLAAAADPQLAAAQFISASPLAAAHQRMMTPAEVAESIFFLASEDACMITGTAIAIDGGKSLGVPPND